MSATDPVERLLDALENVKKNGTGHTARCPGHDDRHNSLKVDTGKDGQALIHCHAGCEPARVVGALGWTLADLYPPRAERVSQNGHGRRIVATYDYCDEDGSLLFQAVRFEPKGFAQRRPDGNGGWLWNLAGVRHVPYRLPELLAADPAAWVLIPEGEKDVEALVALGFVATTNAAGAGKWRPELSAHLRGRRVCPIPDHDEAGEAHAATVAQSLTGIATDVRVLRFPNLSPKGDISDWLDAGGTGEDLDRLIEGAPAWVPPTDAPTWEEPAPLPVNEQPEFPTSLLPEPLRVWVEAEALATQTPPALAAMTTIGIASTAVAKRVVVEVRPDWTEPTNTYTLVPLDSGNRKSAVAQAVGAPLLASQKERARALAPDIARARAKRDVVEKRLERLKKTQAANPTDDLTLEADIRTTVEELLSDALTVPVAPQYLVDDVTPEKLADLLGAHGERMGVLSAEGGIFQVIAGRYSEGRADGLDLFLKGHSGDYLPIDRIGRPTKHLEAPALTLVLAPQPEVLSGLTRFPGFRGRGLLARFAYAVPVSTVGRRRVAAPPVADEVKKGYERLITNLLALPGPEAGAAGNSVDSVYEFQPLALTFSDAAAATFMAFEAWLEPQLARDDGALGDIADWGSKLAGLVARWAGIFHAIEHVRPGAEGEPSSRLDSMQIGEETVAHMVDIAKTFLIPHARTAFAMMGADRSESRAHRVLGVVRAWSEKTITRRDIHQSTRRSIPEVNDLDRPLAMLEEHGYLRRLPTETNGAGRKPSPTFVINPRCRTVASSSAGHQRQNDVDTSHEHANPPKAYTESTELRDESADLNSVDSVYGFQGSNTSSEGSQDAPPGAGDWTHRGALALDAIPWDAAPEPEEWTLPDPCDVTPATYGKPPLDTPTIQDGTEHEDSVTDVLAHLERFTPQEVEQFRREVADAAADDSFAAVDRAALAHFDSRYTRSTGVCA